MPYAGYMLYKVEYELTMSTMFSIKLARQPGSKHNMKDPTWIAGGGGGAASRLLIWACGIVRASFSFTSVPSGTAGFFFFSLARIEDSLSGNGGISSKTVA